VDTPPRPFEVNASLNANPDPSVRAGALREALKAIPEFQQWLRLARQQAIVEMHAAGKSYRQIGKEHGISAARVQQIIEGRTRGHHAAQAQRPTPVEDRAPGTALE
jgi:DNA-directed RNA polymerase specialized sigma24 family protein